jgi:hypothetical protein
MLSSLFVCCLFVCFLFFLLYPHAILLANPSVQFTTGGAGPAEFFCCFCCCCCFLGFVVFLLFVIISFLLFLLFVFLYFQSAASPHTNTSFDSSSSFFLFLKGVGILSFPYAMHQVALVPISECFVAISLAVVWLSVKMGSREGKMLCFFCLCFFVGGVVSGQQRERER